MQDACFRCENGQMDDKIGQFLQIGGTQKLIPIIRLSNMSNQRFFNFTESLIFLLKPHLTAPPEVLTSDIPGM